MRPLVSSRVLYVDLLVSTSTTMTTPSSAGISPVEARTSFASPHACVTEATLSTTTVRIPFMSALLSGTTVEDVRRCDDRRDAALIGRGPLPGGFAVHALRRTQERPRRFHPLDEERAAPEQHVDGARDARLRAHEKRLDVTAHGIEQLSFVHEVAVRLCEQLLDPLLARREHELLELAMRQEQRFGGGRLEGHTSLGADDGIAQMNAAADAERGRDSLQQLDDLHRRLPGCVELDGN